MFCDKEVGEVREGIHVDEVLLESVRVQKAFGFNEVDDGCRT